MIDKLSLYLIDKGYSLSPYYWNDTEIELGTAFEIDGTLLVYRVETEQKKVIICIIRRDNSKKSLGTPFKPLFVLANAACNSLPNYFSLEGEVNVFSYSRLNNERSEKFYRLLGAKKDKGTKLTSIKLENINPKLIQKYK